MMNFHKFKIPERLLSRLVNSTLLALSLLCFGLFGRNSYLGITDELSAPIAKVSHGEPERKKFGMLVFSEAKPGTNLYDRDAIWVGSGKSAQIHFDVGAIMNITENTFLILHRQRGLDDEVEVVQGKVAVEKSKTTTDGKKVLIDYARPPEPETAPSTLPSNGPSHELTNPAVPPPSSGPTAPEYLRPKPKTVFYLMKPRPEIEITFAWPEGFEGELIITSHQKQIFRTKTNSERFTRTRLKTGQSYEWKIVHGDKILTGPFTFSIARFDKNELAEALTNGSPSHPIEIIN